MPDMQSALVKALEDGKRRFLATTISDWDRHEQTIRQPQPTTEKKVSNITKTGNGSKDTFDLILKNPGTYTTVQAAAILTGMGYKRGSINSLFTQMKRNGMFKKDADGKLHATQPAYTPFDNPYKTNPTGRKSKIKPAPKVRPASQGIAALAKGGDWVSADKAVLPNLSTAKAVLANINVGVAFELYQELSKMFGGAK